MVNFDSKKYWEERYSSNQTSGAGSYGEEAEFKSRYINSIIEKYSIDTISDFGCGDGNQISMFTGFKKYFGYDFSKTTIDNCKLKFKDDERYQFEYETVNMPISDISLSLDVTYHIVEDNYFETYMHEIFKKSKKYVLIYSMNREDKTCDNMSIHLKNRLFLDWISENYPDSEMIEFVKFDKKTNDVGFYLIKKND